MADNSVGACCRAGTWVRDAGADHAPWCSSLLNFVHHIHTRSSWYEGGGHVWLHGIAFTLFASRLCGSTIVGLRCYHYKKFESSFNHATSSSIFIMRYWDEKVDTFIRALALENYYRCYLTAYCGGESAVCMKGEFEIDESWLHTLGKIRKDFAQEPTLPCRRPNHKTAHGS